MHLFAIVLAVSLISNVVNSSETTPKPITMPDTTPPGESMEAILAGKHESLATCGLFVLYSDEFRLLPNGSADLFMINKTVDEQSYFLKDDELHFCFSHLVEEKVGTPQEWDLMPLLTMIGMAVSMISLVLHLIAFCLVPDLRNLPGWNLAALCLSLLISYLLMTVITGLDMSGSGVSSCVTLASMTHFFLLASIIWMTVLSYDVFMSLMRATGSFRSSKTKFNKGKFGVYCAWAYGTSLVFAVLGVLADRLDFLPNHFRPEFDKLCWFNQKYSLILFFAGPVFFLSAVNFILFGLSAYVIHSNKMKQDSDIQKSVLKRRYLMYFRLSVIMGATWIVGTVANIIRAEWTLYLFVVLNTLQGFFIFLAFTCCKKVKKFFSQKLLSARRRSSQQTLTSPTFQSYCFYANSIEKDLDKIVESNKEKTDHIIIHI